MVDSLKMAALGTGFIFLMTVLGAATVYMLTKEGKSSAQNVTLGFAAGVMTAASVWSLLLPAMERSEALRLPIWLPCTVGIVLGVAVLTGLDALVVRLSAPNADDRQNVLLFSAITLHNIPEGMAVGLAFALAGSGESLTAAWALALGIGIQNFPEGAAIALPIRNAGRSKNTAFLYGALSGMVEPLFGLLAVAAAAQIRALMPWLLSFAAGAMLDVVVDELVPQAHGKGGTLGFVSGFLIMMILDISLG